MYQLTLDTPTSWVVLALITFLTGYYVQIINRLRDFRLGDPRRESPKYHPIMTWLSWMVALLFVAIFALIIRISLVLPLHARLIFDYINIYVIIGSIAGSQIIHLVIFFWSYGEDMMRYFGGRYEMSSDNYRRKALAYEKAAKCYEKAGNIAKTKEARKRAADNYEKEAERKLKEVRIDGFRVHLVIHLVAWGWVLFYGRDQLLRPILPFLLTWLMVILLVKFKFFERRRK